MDLLETDGITVNTSGISKGWAAWEQRSSRNCAVKIEMQPEACNPGTSFSLIDGGPIYMYYVSPVAVLATLALSTNCAAPDDDTWLKGVVKDEVDTAVARALVTKPDADEGYASPWFGHPDTTRMSGGTATPDAATIGKAYSEWFKQSVWGKDVKPILHVPPSMIPNLKTTGALVEKDGKLVSSWDTEVVSSPAYDWGTDTTFAAWTGPIEVSVSSVESTGAVVDGRKNTVLDTANVIFVIDTPPCSIVTVGIAAP